MKLSGILVGVTLQEYHRNPLKIPSNARFEIKWYSSGYSQYFGGNTTEILSGCQRTILKMFALDLIYMYTKYHQNISYGIRVIERTSFHI